MAMAAPDPTVSTAARTADVAPMAGAKLINEKYCYRRGQSGRHDR
jgi:hypothetical protein